MPKFFCDYCDVYLTHDSMSVRKAHNSGRNHLRNVQQYYEQISSEHTQLVINSITDAYATEGQDNPLTHPMGPLAMGGMGGPPMGFPGAHAGGPPPFPGFPPPGMPGLPPGMPPPFMGRGGPPSNMPPHMPPFPPPNMPPGGPSPMQNMPFPPPPNMQGGPGNMPFPPFPGPPGQAGSPPGGLPFPPPMGGPQGPQRFGPPGQ
ncbi:U1 zinc finger-domain-containing protein [Lophiotrema nucula]|uniref:U1 small nuclear ribonucleoprotein C n=1 Tax=Lophiotrema nucula TaxID=690887 RepID=A0A6A5YV06_9PLEO|nr:U1 zinc finger-domain-containing protein [Lophiotrema nucula]